MTIGQRLRYLFAAYFSRPAGDRVLWKLVVGGRVQRIMQVGLGDGRRAQRLLDLAAWQFPVDQLRFTGIDLFESRGAEQGPGLSLKEAHRLLKPTGAAIQLAPGDPHAALSRVANGIPGTQLVLIAHDVDPAALARAMFYLPRALAAEARVLVERPPVDGQPTGWDELSRSEIESRAAAAAPITRRAA